MARQRKQKGKKEQPKQCIMLQKSSACGKAMSALACLQEISLNTEGKDDDEFFFKTIFMYHKDNK